MKRTFLKFENIDFLAYFSSKGRHVTCEVGVALRALCTVLSEYIIYMAGKSIVTICFIITQLLKFEWGENSYEVNTTSKVIRRQF